MIRPRRIPQMSFPLPPSFIVMQLCPSSSHLYKCYSMTLLSPKLFRWPPTLCHRFPSKHVVLCNNDVFNCLFISPFSLFAEWYLVRALLLCCVQGNEPHAVHRLWPAGPGESIRYLAHHAEYDCRSHLLCCFYWPCNSSYPILGLVQTPVSGKGEGLH